MKGLEFEGYWFIDLNKLIKITNLVGTGREVNVRIENGEILVKCEVETHKRNKLRVGTVVAFGVISVNVI